MRVIIDYYPALEKGEQYYRTQDIIEITGWTIDELRHRVKTGEFPPCHIVQRVIWPKDWVEYHLRDYK